jgi:hypothetical protein
MFTFSLGDLSVFIVIFIIVITFVSNYFLLLLLLRFFYLAVFFCSTEFLIELKKFPQIKLFFPGAHVSHRSNNSLL